MFQKNVQKPIHNNRLFSIRILIVFQQTKQLINFLALTFKCLLFIKILKFMYKIFVNCLKIDFWFDINTIFTT